MALFGVKVQEEALRALEGAVDDLLAPVGYAKSDERTWRRRVEWRIDEIELVVKGGTAKHLLPSFRVMLPRNRPSQSGEAYQHIAQANIPRLLHPDAGPEFDISVPSVSFRRQGFVQSVVSDIRTALSWFDQFATPEQCKANLSKFLKPGCPAYLDAEQVLNSLIGR